MQTKRAPLGKFLILGILFGVILYYGAGYVGLGAKKQQNAALQGVPVSVAVVIAKPITLWTEFSGIFEAVQAVEIRPRVSGQITGIHFADGQNVVRGTPLFTIDTRPYEAALVQAKGALTTAQSAESNAKAEFIRASKLIRSRAISQSEYDNRLSVYHQAQGALNTAQGALKTAQVNLSYTHISAPFAGKIGRAEITEGNQVEAGGSAPLLATIVALAPIYASFNIDEQTYLSTIQGVSNDKLKTIPVEVGLSNEAGTALQARIHSFDNRLGADSGTIRVRAVLDNLDKTLLPGLFARVRIGTPEPVEALLINPAAVGTDQSKKFVMVVDADNKAQYREVTLGSLSDGLQVIASGLKAGETIIVNGLQRVQPGVPVAGARVDMMTLAPLVAATPDAQPSDNAAASAPAADAQKAP